MAAAGALARVLNMREQTETKNLLSQMFVSAFMGVCLYWFTDVLNVDQGLMFALAGVAGWMGPRVMDLITEMVTKKTGLQLDSSVIPDSNKPPGGDSSDA